MLEIGPVERTSTVDRAAESLRAAMFSGAIEPGTALREVRLAESLEVSRSTVREALAVLAQEGLVTRLPHRGVVVTELSDDDVEEIFRARRILEVAGVRAAASAGQDELSGLRAAQDHYAAAVGSRDQQAAVAAHLGFHAALVGLLGSTRLSAAAQALLADVRLAMATAARTDDDATRQVADHARLLGLVEASVGGAGAADAAEAEVVEHLSKGAASLTTHVHRHSTR